jgi:hypothetical protein
MPIIPAHVRNHEQVDQEARVGYTVRPCLKKPKKREKKVLVFK